ncbi:MAG: type transport system permease protein [Patescibacteria group bacterium]|nr:type transport system permease protein [Patescibacteria group bacterium]
MRYLTTKNRAILREMVVADFKVRYQESVLGYLWSLLKPLFMFAILFVLFTYIIPISKGHEHYGIMLLTGIVMWNFFSETTTMGANSVVNNGDLLRKISIPRYLMVLTSSMSALINLAINSLVIIVFAVVSGVHPTLEWILVIPIFVELFVFSLGIAFLLAALTVKFRDITYIWEIFLQGGFYASVIIFPITMVPESVRDYFYINPIVQMVQDARNFILGSSAGVETLWVDVDSIWLTIAPFAVILFFAVLGAWYFKRRSPYFAEDV